jgi:hypothetical protein
MTIAVTIFAGVIFLCALAWHDQPARNSERGSLAGEETELSERVQP